MLKNTRIKILIATILLSFSVSLSTAQSVDGWYKVLTGKMGNFSATLHLHKSAKNFSGYLWFLQNQWPMQLYYNESLKNTDSLMLSAVSGPLSVTLSGVLKGDIFSGIAELSKDNGSPKQSAFELHVNTEKSFTPFAYYYTEGFSKLPPQLKNQSECNYKASAIWPVSSTSTDESYKNIIRQMFGIKTPVAEIGNWLLDEKNRYISTWKKEHSKLAPKEASELGLSLTRQEEIRVLVMYENEKHITLANYNSGYSGGAHEYFETTLATFDKQTGKKFILPDVVTAGGIKLLPGLLEQVARLQYGIKNNKPLNQNGFLAQLIKPSQNFYITDNGIGFFYAPYSIKSFADGEINLLVPFTALKSYLQPGIGGK